MPLVSIRCPNLGRMNLYLSQQNLCSFLLWACKLRRIEIQIVRNTIGITNVHNVAEWMEIRSCARTVIPRDKPVLYMPQRGTGNSCLRDDPDASMICYSEEAGTEHFKSSIRRLGLSWTRRIGGRSWWRSIRSKGIFRLSSLGEPTQAVPFRYPIFIRGSASRAYCSQVTAVCECECTTANFAGH
jgi:hypothetical protein